MNVQKAIRYPILKVISQFKKFEHEINFMIFSEPRGGSTWLTQMIKTIPETALIWEPINPKVYAELRNMNFGWRQYIPEDEKWNDAECFFDNIFRGRSLSYHTSDTLTISDFINARRLIIKFVRGNALLPWITKRLKFKYKPIYLVRHPFAVVQSQLQHGAWNSVHPQIDLSLHPFFDHFTDFHDLLKSIQTLEEKLVAGWCIANKYTLENERNDQDWITIFYEDLVTKTKTEIQKIFEIWDLDIPKELYSEMEKPSRTVKNNAYSSLPSIQLSKWQVYFDEERIDRMTNILSHFDIKIYCKDSCLPQK